MTYIENLTSRWGTKFTSAVAIASRVDAEGNYPRSLAKAFSDVRTYALGVRYDINSFDPSAMQKATYLDFYTRRRFPFLTARSSTTYSNKHRHLLSEHYSSFGLYGWGTADRMVLAKGRRRYSKVGRDTHYGLSARARSYGSRRFSFYYRPLRFYKKFFPQEKFRCKRDGQYFWPRSLPKRPYSHGLLKSKKPFVRGLRFNLWLQRALFHVPKYLAKRRRKLRLRSKFFRLLKTTKAFNVHHAHPSLARFVLLQERLAVPRSSAACHFHTHSCFQKFDTALAFDNFFNAFSAARRFTNEVSSRQGSLVTGSRYSGSDYAFKGVSSTFKFMCSRFFTSETISSLNRLPLRIKAFAFFFNTYTWLSYYKHSFFSLRIPASDAIAEKFSALAFSSAGLFYGFFTARFFSVLRFHRFLTKPLFGYTRQLLPNRYHRRTRTRFAYNSSDLAPAWYRAKALKKFFSVVRTSEFKWLKPATLPKLLLPLFFALGRSIPDPTLKTKFFNFNPYSDELLPFASLFGRYSERRTGRKRSRLSLR